MYKKLLVLVIVITTVNISKYHSYCHPHQHPIPSSVFHQNLVFQLKFLSPCYFLVLVNIPQKKFFLQLLHHHTLTKQNNYHPFHKPIQFNVLQHIKYYYQYQEYQKWYVFIPIYKHGLQDRIIFLAPFFLPLINQSLHPIYYRQFP